MANGEDLGGRRKKSGQESIGSVDADPEGLDSRKEEEKGAQGTQGLFKNCRESLFPLSRLVRGFVISLIDPFLGYSTYIYIYIYIAISLTVDGPQRCHLACDH